VLVGRLGQADNVRLGSDGLTERDDGLRELEGDTSVVLLEILEADLKMELTSTSDDVLTRLGHVGKAKGIRLGQTLETFDELGEIVGVLDLDGDLGGKRKKKKKFVIICLF